MKNSGKTSDQPSPGRDPAVAQQRQYFEVRDRPMALIRAPQLFDWVNEKELEIPGYVGLGPGRHECGAGFPAFVSPPKIVFEKKGTCEPMDFYEFDRIWVISERLKAILENFDRDGFEFVRTETLYDGGAREGPSYWFCDVIRVLDCIDEDASTLNYYQSPRKRYSVIKNAVMRPEAAGSAHVLRLRYYSWRVLGDDVFRNLVRAHKVSGIGFIPLDGSRRHVVR
jgi:hypothetical protein